MSKKIEGITKAIKVLKDASKSSSGKESKLEKSAKKIEDMKKDPKFIRLRKRANEIRKKKGLPPKPEFSKGGMVTKWEQKWGQYLSKLKKIKELISEDAVKGIKFFYHDLHARKLNKQGGIDPYKMTSKSRGADNFPDPIIWLDQKPRGEKGLKIDASKLNKKKFENEGGGFFTYKGKIPKSAIVKEKPKNKRSGGFVTKWESKWG